VRVQAERTKKPIDASAEEGYRPGFFLEPPQQIK
jgi:hypothetical protein